MKRLILIPFDQLNTQYGALRTADRQTDAIALVESSRMVQGRGWHKQRLHFLLSSARHFAEELKADGWDATYVKADTTVNGLQQAQEQYRTNHVVCATPNSYVMRAELERAGVSFVPNDFFLTSPDQFSTWVSKYRSPTMESFYRAQRKRLDLLMDGGEPVGGSWNYDSDNRLPPPTAHNWGATLTFRPDDIDTQVVMELPDTAWGDFDGKVWGTTRAEALAQLTHFLEVHFADFGPYEDAMPQGTWAAHHSLLSPYLNNGLLHPAEVVHAAIARFNKGDIPLSSCEGFIRQIIGWREYVNGMYWHMGAGYRDNNHLGAGRNLPVAYRQPSATSMACLSSVVTDVKLRGWTHHIPRLMVLGNLALLSGVEPRQLLNWMREVFVDAADWVMVPNIIGMAAHADGSVMMTKPYAAGGAYISRMGRYCGGCPYDPKKRTGADSCPFTTLYWDFLDRNRSEFTGNHRMAQQYSLLDRLTDLDEVRARAGEVLAGLDAGTV